MVVLEQQNMKENVKIYNSEVRRIRKLIGKKVPIHHVGSTALPYMVGKNIIDILVGASDEKEMEELTIKLKKLGFFPGRKSTGSIYRFFASTEEETKSGDVHVHLVKMDSDRYRDFLILKEYLLKNKAERKAYAALKKEILKSGHDIREDYKSIKSKYVTELLQRARENVGNI